MAFLRSPVHRASRITERGFSLLEALATVGILVIIMTVAIPYYRDTLLSQQLSDTTNHLLTALQLARAEAIKRQTRVAICARARTLCAPSSAWHEGWSIVVDDNRDRLLRNGDLVIRQFADDPPGVKILSSRNSSIVFDVDGRSAGSNTTLTVCHPEALQALRVVLNNAGRVRTERIPRSGITGCATAMN